MVPHLIKWFQFIQDSGSSVTSGTSHSTKDTGSRQDVVIRTELAPLGEIKLSLQYHPQESTLRLIVIKAENLPTKGSAQQQLNIFTKVCFLPDKTHRQISKVIKCSHNACINQQFMFKDVKPARLEETHLRLRICNQLSTRRYETLGEITLPLMSLGLHHGEEVRMWRDVEPKSSNQVIITVTPLFCHFILSNICLYSHLWISIVWIWEL